MLSSASLSTRLAFDREVINHVAGVLRVRLKGSIEG